MKTKHLLSSALAGLLLTAILVPLVAQQTPPPTRPSRTTAHGGTNVATPNLDQIRQLRRQASTNAPVASPQAMAPAPLAPAAPRVI